VRSIRAFAVAAVAASAIALPAAGANAAVLHPTKEFTTPTVTVTTTTGVKVHLSIDLLRDGYASMDVDLNKATRKQAEDHDWTFDVKGSDLTYSKGKGTLQTGRQFGPYGFLKLSFTKVAQVSRSCHNDNGAATKVTNVKASVKGTVVFKARSSYTQSSKWGAVRYGTSTKPYHFGYNYAHYISTTNGRCGVTFHEPAGNPACVSGTLWQGPVAGVSSMRFVTGASQQGFGAQIEGLRMVSLSYPSNATRMDFVGVTAPEPVLDTSGAQPVLTVSTTSGSAASGSASLTATAAPTAQPDSPCTDAGTTKTESISDYETADYTNGTAANGSAPLTLMSNIGNNISVPNSVGGASFVNFSYA
jgi:hypothetical protein